MSAAVWSNLINVALLICAIVAAFIAGAQARQSGRDREASQAASAAALEHESAALAAAEKSATAESRMANELAEANKLTRASMPADPWKLTQHDTQKYELANTGRLTLRNVKLVELSGGNDVVLFDDEPVGELLPGQSIYFAIGRTLASPPTTNIEVTWNYEDDPEPHVWRRSLA